MNAITVDCSQIGQVEFFNLLKANKDDTCVVITDIGTLTHLNVIKAALDGILVMRTFSSGEELYEEFEFTSKIIITYKDIPSSLAFRMWPAGSIWISMEK